MSYTLYKYTYVHMCVLTCDAVIVSILCAGDAVHAEHIQWSSHWEVSEEQGGGVTLNNGSSGCQWRDCAEMVCAVLENKE